MPPVPKSKPKTRFPWLPFLLLLASVYMFWIYPLHTPKPELKIDFEPTATAKP